MDVIEVVPKEVIEVVTFEFGAIVRNAVQVKVCLAATTGCVVSPQRPSSCVESIRSPSRQCPT